MTIKQLTLKEAFQPQVDQGYAKFFFLSLKQNDLNGIVLEMLSVCSDGLDNLEDTFEILPTVNETFHAAFPRLRRKT